MKTPGQPTAYKAEHCSLARNFCRLGATNEELARFLEVSPRTVDNWIATHDAFAHAVREGRQQADAEVAKRLYERALGYVQVIEKRELWRGEERISTTKVHLAPDTNACMFWLRNRHPKQWRRRLDEPENDPEEMIKVLEAAGERLRRVRNGEPPSQNLE